MVFVYWSFWEVKETEPHRFEPWLSQTNDFKIDTCRHLARCSALLILGYGKDWLAQFQAYMIELDHDAGRWFPSKAALYDRHECPLSQVGTDPDMTLGVARK